MSVPDGVTPGSLADGVVPGSLADGVVPGSAPGSGPGTVLWVDASAGASGDMLLGALADLGVPLEVMQAAVNSVMAGVTLTAAPTARHGIAATAAVVAVASDGEAAAVGAGAEAEAGAGAEAVSRPWSEVRRLLEGAPLDPAVRQRALATFARLARAEAQAHRVDVEEVHFHEVGAHDAVADVVGVCAGLAWLGSPRVVVSAVALGSGTALGLHGGIPVPGPAVLALLTEVRAPVFAGAAPHEACTPTGAALLAEHAAAWGPLPAMTVRGTGNGAGGRDLPEVPNLLRLVAGVAAHEPVASASIVAADGGPDGELTAAARGEHADGEETEQVVIEANVDDLDPRLWPRVLVELLDAGASDAWLTPILMKKGRPAHTVSVLVDDAAAERAREVVLTRTSAIGLREHRVSKHALVRAERVVEVWGLPVRVKVASHAGEVVNVQPEYDDVASAAAATGRSEKATLAQAVAAAHLLQL